MNQPQIFAAALCLILSTLAGWLLGGPHGALVGLVLGGAAIVWKYA